MAFCLVSLCLINSFLATVATVDDPMWGCGLLGTIPGISKEGLASASAQMFIDGIKNTSSFGKVNYWNWNFAPMKTESGDQYLTKDFIFVPNNWGVEPVSERSLRKAGKQGFKDLMGNDCPAEMASLLLGANEPDIVGSCMGSMMGKCTAPCQPDEHDCPVAHLSGPEQEANAKGHCDCSTSSQATGAGFWPVEGCHFWQPLPWMWQDAGCVTKVIDEWHQTAKVAVRAGYKYLSTPLVAVDIDYARKFIEEACGCAGPGRCACTDASCGCPVYVGFHFYAFDCQPEATGGYKDFQTKLQQVAGIMEDYPFVKGAIINEVGMLNCAAGTTAGCVPNSGKYPASSVPDRGCPSNPELPNGLATFMDKLFDLVTAARTTDGRPVVKLFAWFNENMAGGTYNLQLFDDDGSVNKVGEAYIRGCQRWAAEALGPHKASVIV